RIPGVVIPSSLLISISGLSFIKAKLSGCKRATKHNSHFAKT
ncbi:MAG: hypothetical protein ACI8SE_002191, partial [Bacteroidia bacterium]